MFQSTLIIRLNILLVFTPIFALSSPKLNSKAALMRRKLLANLAVQISLQPSLLSFQ